MKFVDHAVLPKDPSLHQVERQLRQENQLVALKQPSANPSKDGHAQGVAQVENSAIHGV